MTGSSNNKNDIQPDENTAVINQLWLDAFILEFKQVLNSIESVEGASLPFSSGYLSTVLAEDLLNKNESLKKWAEILGNRLRKDSHKVLLENEKLKIVFITGVFPGTGHGGGLRAFDLIQELSLRGHEIHLYTSNTQFEDGEATEVLRSVCASLNIVEGHNFVQANFEEWLESNDHHFDIAYYIWPWSVNLFTRNSNRIKRIAFEYIECTARRLWLDLNSFPLETSSEKIRATLHDFLTHFYWELAAAKAADILVAVSEKDTRFIKGIYLDSEAKVIATGLSRFEFQNVSQAVSVTPYPSACFVGNYFHYPNLDGLAWYLNHVHGLILRSVPNYKFAVLGKGNPEAIEAFKAKYQHFADSLIWVGAFDKVASALSPYTICLCPLISGAGLRGKVIQYAALKKATVSTTIGICGTAFAHGDSILCADDPEEFAACAIKLLRDETFRAAIAARALAVTEQHYSWSASIDALETHFREGTK